MSGAEWRLGLWESQKRVWVTMPFAVKDVVKERVPGAKWSPEERFWHFPLDLEVCRDLSRVAKDYGDTVAVEPELARWARAEKQRYSVVLNPAAAVDQSQWETLLPSVRATRPALWNAMRDIAINEDGIQETPWQIVGSAFVAAQRNVLLADQPGLGKTVQTLAAVAELDVKGCILVVAPRSAVRVTWPAEIAQWLGDDEKVFVINAEIPPSARRARVRAAQEFGEMGGRAWILCGPNYLRIKADIDDNTGDYLRDRKGKKIIRAVNETIPELFGITWAAVIVDESHKTLAGATGNKKKQSGQRLGLGALTTKPDAIRLAISGTPFRGKTENLWGTLNWLMPSKYTSYWNWIKRHYGMIDSGSAYGATKVKGEKILDEKRFFSELKPIMVRRTKAEVAKALPPKRYGGTHLDPHDDTTPVAVWLDMSPKQAAQYKEIEKEALINVGTEDEITVNGVLAEMTRCKQVANACLKPNGKYNATGDPLVSPVFPSNKAEWIHDFLVDQIDAGTKTIVASQFTGFLNVLSEELNKKGINHYLFTGETSDKERDRIREEFQDRSGKFSEMVVLLNIVSGGVSLTLDMADDVVVVDQTWVPDDQEQVEDRAHRVSRKDHNVTIWNLASRKTIDEDIAILNNNRQSAITSILENQRGVTVAKQLYSRAKTRVEQRETDKAS